MKSIRFETKALKEILELLLKMEKKIDDDLLLMGFKIKRKISVPYYFEEMVGPIAIE
ncbi:MAG: hypothetical protein ACMG6E_09195 [Candidatus Roizmanbacteria bacterium]